MEILKFRIRDKSTNEIIDCIDNNIRLVPDSNQLYTTGNINVTDDYYLETFSLKANDKEFNQYEYNSIVNGWLLR